MTTSTGRLPDFLIVGGQKCGTTTLWWDLRSVPGIHLPGDKEPDALASDAILTDDGLERYRRLFRGSRADQVCGEASTSYTKAPTVPGVPQRAVRVLGRDLRVIYLVREPVARIVSHHRHELSLGEISEPDVDRAVRCDPRFLAYSRYAAQIEPWIREIGHERVRIVRFETYVRRRASTVAEICRFLGVDPDVDGVDPSRAAAGSSRRLPRVTGLWRAVRQSTPYRRLLRPLVPPEWRRVLLERLLPIADARPMPMSPATREWILGELADDLAAQPRVFGTDGPLWSEDELRGRNEVRAEDGP